MNLDILENLTALRIELMLILNCIMRICHGQFPQLENAILAEPRVDCGVESITVWIRMEKPFHGRLYVEDEVDQTECVHSYSRNWVSDTKGPLDSRGADFTIRFGQCNMRRQRLLNPRGVSYSFTLIVSFHPIFLTGIDRAFNIRCFFMEAVKAIETALDVSPLVTSVVEREFSLPHCSYQLKQHGLDGPLMKYATIGEPITHLWQCDPVAGWLYGLLIHSCFVDDGHGKNRFDLVDEIGCVTDRSLLAEISYDEKTFTAYAHTHVFRYADRISPPQCNKEGRVGSALTGSIISSSFIPLDSTEELAPSAYRRGHSKSSLPLKDSPISIANINENITVAKISPISSNNNNRSRAGRDVIEFVNNPMETDLSADLTVVPRTINVISERSKNKDERIAGRDPFIRVLPIKSREYGAATPQLYSLDSQRFERFEVLAIAGASFAIFAVIFILIICLNWRIYGRRKTKFLTLI